MMGLDDHDTDAIALRLATIALEAGEILRRLERALIESHLKADGSPTTSADLAAEELIIRRLGETWDGIPVVAEETSSTTEPDNYFFLVDPLDGTGDYLRRTGEYSVNIALIRKGRPIAAVVAAPAMESIWIAGKTALSAAIPDRPDGDIAWRG
jgi:3'(2'), 5'-bisphosphate nucleotidase